MSKKIIFVLSVLLTAVLICGCTDRGDNIVRPNYGVRNGFQGAFTLRTGHMESRFLAFSMFDNVYKQPLIDIKVYVPKEYPLDNETFPHPVLFLLSPFKGSAQYYLNHGLAQIADRMIESGEIEPMLIVCIDGSHGYGATFYGDSWAGGKYAAAIGREDGSTIDGSIYDYIKGNLKTDTSRSAWGISGFDIGGYGAMRIAIEYSENFGSVSAVSAPLDFDGASGTGGFVEQFPLIVARLQAEGVDFKDMDTSSAYPMRTVVMGAACSFSPHADYINPIWFGEEPWSEDTVYFDDTLTLFTPEGQFSSVAFHLPFDENGNIPFDSFSVFTYFDSLYQYDSLYLLDSIFSYDSTFSIDTTIIDPDTLIDTTLVSVDTTLLNVDSTFTGVDTLLFVDTTMDTCGFYDSVWYMWLDNNMSAILADNPDALDNTEIKLFTLANDEFAFNAQTQDFATYLQSYLQGRGVSKDLTPLQFDGYPGYDANIGRFTYDILPYILRYHSEIFSRK